MKPTNWCIITGAPCSGKTSVILELEKIGFRVVHEAARSYIDEQRKRGKTLETIKSDIHTFEHTILSRKVSTESRLSPTEIVFLDRGIPDSLAYFTLEGLERTVPLRESRQYRYRAVFFFESLACAPDAVRSEDDRKAARLEKLLQEGYRSLGYGLIHIPVVPLDERVELVLSYVKKAGGIKSETQKAKKKKR